MQCCTTLYQYHTVLNDSNKRSPHPAHSDRVRTPIPVYFASYCFSQPDNKHHVCLPVIVAGPGITVLLYYVLRSTLLTTSRQVSAHVCLTYCAIQAVAGLGLPCFCFFLNTLAWISSNPVSYERVDTVLTHSCAAWCNFFFVYRGRRADFSPNQRVLLYFFFYRGWTHGIECPSLIT